MLYSLTKPETVTQAYQAGVIVAQIYNFYPNEDIPPMVTCMVHFSALRELLGERLWQKLKAGHRLKERIRLYESLTYQHHLPKEVIGTSKEFCLGYARAYQQCKRKLVKDINSAESFKQIYEHLNKPVT